MVAQLDGIRDVSRNEFYLELVLVGIPIPIVIDESKIACWCVVAYFVLNSVSV